MIARQGSATPGVYQDCEIVQVAYGNLGLCLDFAAVARMHRERAISQIVDCICGFTRFLRSKSHGLVLRLFGMPLHFGRPPARRPKRSNYGNSAVQADDLDQTQIAEDGASNKGKKTPPRGLSVSFSDRRWSSIPILAASMREVQCRPAYLTGCWVLDN